MAMTKRIVTKYARRRYARRYRRYRSLSNQYFRTKIEGVYTIAFPTDPGAPVFAEGPSRTTTFGDIFRGSQYYSSLTQMFGYYKITGVAIEVIPGPKNFEGTSTIGAKTLVGIHFGSGMDMNYHQLVADNNSIVLGVLTKSRKYVSTMGAIDWLSTAAGTDLDAVGAFCVASSITGTLTNQPTWTCKLSIYLTFKKSMI